MPLTEKVNFTAKLQTSNLVQIPKLIRWRFKMDSEQALKIGVNFMGMHKGWQFFYSKMRKDGRLTIPEMVMCFFEDKTTSLAGHLLDVIIEPA